MGFGTRRGTKRGGILPGNLLTLGRQILWKGTNFIPTEPSVSESPELTDSYLKELFTLTGVVVNMVEYCNSFIFSNTGLGCDNVSRISKGKSPGDTISTLSKGLESEESSTWVSEVDGAQDRLVGQPEIFGRLSQQIPQCEVGADRVFILRFAGTHQVVELGLPLVK